MTLTCIISKSLRFFSKVISSSLPSSSSISPANLSILEMQFHVPIAIAPRRSFTWAFGVIVVIIHRLQMFRGFAFLAQAVIQTGQDLEWKTCFGGQNQQGAQHEALTRLTDLVYCPRAFSEEIRQALGVWRQMERTGQIAQGLALVADNHGVHNLQQMSYLRLVKCKLQGKNKIGERFGMLYNQGEHW